MRVFNGYMKLMKRNLGPILLYFGIFVMITMLIQTAMQGGGEDSFSLSSMKITLIDRDGGELAQGLRQYLEVDNELVDLADNRDTLRDALYYRTTQYIVYVPENFEKDCLQGNEKIGITAVPGSYMESYVTYQVNTYIDHVRTYENSGLSTGEAVKQTIKLQDVKTNVALQKGSNAEKADYMYSFQYFPYLYLSSLSSAIGLLLVIFRKEDVKERVQCAPVSSTRRMAEMIFSLAIISVVFWVLSLLLPVLQSQGRVMNDPHLGYLVLNSLLLLLSALGIAVIIGTLIKRQQLVTNVATVVSLGLSFLCGVFVPLSIMGSGVKKVTQLLPVYWYETINDMLGSYRVLTDTMKATLYRGFAVQIAFAAACVGVSMVISRVQEQKK